MKHNTIFKFLLPALLAFGAVSCAEKGFEELTEIQLSRCLTPQNLSATVNQEAGNEVTLSWDAARDADSYKLVICTDEAFSVEALSRTVDVSEVPITLTLPVDQTYWFKVQALHAEKEASAWAKCNESFETVAVKGNLFVAVAGKTSTSITLSWNTEAEDSDEVTVIRYGAPGAKSADMLEYALSPTDIAAGKATVDGLTAGTEYTLGLYYYSASRGQLNAWTLPDMSGAIAVSNVDALKTQMVAGGKIRLTTEGSPYDVGEITPTGNLVICGEESADGSRPVLTARILIDGSFAGNEIVLENLCLDGKKDPTNDFLLSHKAATAVNIDRIVLRNCEFTGYNNGVFYSNGGDGLLTITDFTMDACEIHDVPGGGGDFFDLRKNVTIPKVSFKGCTIYDVIRTMFRTDATTPQTVNVTTIALEGNTIKRVSVMDSSNNRGIFGLRTTGYDVTLKKNLFLCEEDANPDATKTRAHLFQNDSKCIVPTSIDASDNYFYLPGKDYFKKVSLAEVNGTILESDPCVNAKGNIFNLTDNALVKKQVGAARWWLAYVEKEEDLTFPLTTAPHTWDFSDARLFSGTVKKEMVRDGLYIHASESAPLAFDNSLGFPQASVRGGSGLPMDGYVSFKVNAPGTIYIKVTDPQKLGSNVIIATSTGGVQAAVAANPSLTAPQKVMLSDIAGETEVQLYATGPMNITALSWTTDMTPVNTALGTPGVELDVEKVTEGDETTITASWAAVPNAGGYKVTFKNAATNVTETSFVIDAATVAGLKPGSYKVEVTAVPAAGDIYNTESPAGVAAFAVLSKGGEEPTGEPVTLTWDFSSADWQTAFGTWTGASSGSDCTAAFETTVRGLTLTINKTGEKNRYGDKYFQFGGAGNKLVEGVRDGNRVLKFKAPAAGTLKVTTSTTGNTPDLSRSVGVIVGTADPQTKDGAGVAANADHAVLEFEIGAGDVVIYPATNGLRFYVVEFTYLPPEEHYAWDFSTADWQTAFGKWTDATSGSDCTTAFETTVDGLTLTINKSGEKNRYGDKYFQFGGAGNKLVEGVRDGNRVLKFTTATAGKLKVTTSTTGNTADLTRSVGVIVGDAAPQVKDGAGVAANAEHAVLEFDIEAGNVVVYPATNGLRFYSLQFDTVK